MIHRDIDLDSYVRWLVGVNMNSLNEPGLENYFVQYDNI